MSKIRFFTDEDVYASIAVQLRSRCFDAVSTPEVGRCGETDESQLQWAAQDNRSLVTFNVAHLAKLHYEWVGSNRHHAGIIVSKQASVRVVINRLLKLASELNSESMKDRLEYLSNW